MLIEVEVSLERSLFLLLVGFYFQPRKPSGCMLPGPQQQFDQCDQVEEERGRGPI